MKFLGINFALNHFKIA